MPVDKTLGITVVIPTLDRPECMAACVQDLLSQHYELLEILLVDQSDQPDRHMLELAALHPETISYHHVSFRGLPTARNYASKHARHDAILFLDDDIRCYPALLAEHARCLQLSGVGIVAGAVEEAREQGDPSTGGETGRFNPMTAVPGRAFEASGEFDVDHAAGGNFSVWRNVFESCRGIDEILGVGAALYEETDFCLRVRHAGYRVLFNGAARILHLAVPRGGCRVPIWHEYIWGLAHNRTILIQRHVKWYYRPLALGRLWITGASFSLRKRNLKLLIACGLGTLGGISDANRSNR